MQLLRGMIAVLEWSGVYLYIFQRWQSLDIACLASADDHGNAHLTLVNLDKNQSDNTKLKLFRLWCVGRIFGITDNRSSFWLLALLEVDTLGIPGPGGRTTQVAQLGSTHGPTIKGQLGLNHGHDQVSLHDPTKLARSRLHDPLDDNHTSSS
jgi:hypothetical protein